MEINWLRGTDSPSELLLNPRLPLDRVVQARTCFQAAPNSLKLNHLFLLSSGSETAPKLIALSRNSILSAAAAANDHLRSTPQDVWALTLPTFHVGGLGVLARAELSEAAVAEFGESWTAPGFVAFLKSDHITLASLVPAQLYDLCRLGATAPESLRAVIIGGGALSPELYTEARSLGWPVLPSYGMTECCSQVATAPLASLLDSEFPGLELLNHLQVRTNERGCYDFRGSSLLSSMAWIDLCEWKDPKTPDGWFSTGDRGEISQVHSKVVLNPLGRLGRMVKIKGENVSLDDVESRMKQKIMNAFPNKVFDVRLSARPDERNGSKLWLVLEADADALGAPTPKAVKAFQDEVLAPYERSELLFYVRNFPRSALGKINGADLNKMLTVMQSRAKTLIGSGQ